MNVDFPQGNFRIQMCAFQMFTNLLKHNEGSYCLHLPHSIQFKYVSICVSTQSSLQYNEDHVYSIILIIDFNHLDQNHRYVTRSMLSKNLSSAYPIDDISTL